MSLVYKPSEDSLMLESVLKNYVKNKSVLDMGAGSGILAESAIKSKAESVLAVDINLDAVKVLKKKGIPAAQSNLFSKIKTNQRFDIIIFNPPYLPQDKREDKESQLATTGGKNGDEIILRFLKSAPKYLRNNGVILLLLSSFTPKEKMLELLKKNKMNYNIIASQKLFFEELFIWEIKRP